MSARFALGIRARVSTRLQVAALGVVGLLVITTSVIVAASPPNPGPFTGCLTTKAVKGLIYNVAASPTTPQAPCLSGDTVITFSNGQGLQGPTGPQGPQGLPGVKGDTGLTGPQGLPGVKGDTGLTGPQGLPGAKGDTGPQGLPGLKGDTGPQGLPGDKGDTGLQGPQGLPGAKGDTGQPGVDGTNGTNGAPGQPGTPGANGSSIRLSSTPPSSAECPTGGQAYEIVDGTGAVVLGSRKVVCNGAKGDTGPTGPAGVAQTHLHYPAGHCAPAQPYDNCVPPSGSILVAGSTTGFTITCDTGVIVGGGWIGNGVTGSGAVIAEEYPFNTTSWFFVIKNTSGANIDIGESRANALCTS